MKNNNSADFITAQARDRVLVLIYGYVQDEPRIRRQGAVIVREGYQVTAIGAARHGGISPKSEVDGIQIILAPVITSLNPLHILKMIWQLISGDVGTITATPPQNRNRLRSGLTLLFYNLWVLRLGLTGHYDLIHVHGVWPVPLAVLLRWWHSAKLIYDPMEYVPGLFPPGMRRRLVTWIEKIGVRWADTIISTGERTTANFIERFRKPVVLIGNWRDPKEYEITDSDFYHAERERLKIDSYNLVITYIGLFLAERSLLPLLEAVADSPDVALLIGGRGEHYHQVVAYSRQHPNIHFLDWVSMDRVPVYNHLGDAIYYCLDPEICHQSFFSPPNKLYEALVSGKALIALKDVGEIGMVVEANKAGILLDKATPANLQAAFQQLKQRDFLAQLQENAKRAGEKYPWSLAEARLKTLYNDLIGSPRDVQQ